MKNISSVKLIFVHYWPFIENISIIKPIFVHSWHYTGNVKANICTILAKCQYLNIEVSIAKAGRNFIQKFRILTIKFEVIFAFVNDSFCFFRANKV